MRQRIGFCTTADGTRIAHATAGRGPPLVRVGTWLTHVERDWDSPVWRHWLEALSEDRTLVRFDLRGSGLSDRRAGELSLDAWVADLEAVVDSLGLRRFPLLGLCHGGAIAVAYAARHPERVSRLILYDSYCRGGLADGRPPEMVEQAQTLARMIRFGWGKRVSAFRQLFANLLMPDAAPELIRSLGDLQRDSASPEGAHRLWNAFHKVDVRAKAPRVSAPTLIFHLEGDAMVPFDEGRQLAASIPGARFVPLPGRNHILTPDDPAWPVFVDETRRFLDEDSLGAGEIADAILPALTRRESAVLELMARGLSNDEIAQALFVTPKTVRNYVSRVFAKLDVERRAQAIVLAREAGYGRRREPESSAPA
jgi:pimeloyl-ACP methyl ester carboxylesterase/DNA-binding CsgD family transcriptional regulator